MFPGRMTIIGGSILRGVGVFIAGALMVTIPFGCCPSSRANGEDQKPFASGEQAVNAFITALRNDDETALRTIFGPDADELLESGDQANGRYIRRRFVNAYDQGHTLQPEGDTLVLVVGENEWPFPIPLIKQGDQWIFDTAVGREEILDRRVGRNELNVVQVMQAIVDAQREFARRDYDGDGLTEYAQKFRSDPGEKNGLYWPAGPDEEPSPLGRLVAQARKADYLSDGRENDLPREPQPYFGYYFKMLTAQGPSASGGQYDYRVRGNMIGGFAVVAYPAQYGNSGVMTFIVNHDGRVYQKDLGEDTPETAADMERFDPDQTWTAVPEETEPLQTVAG